MNEDDVIEGELVDDETHETSYELQQRLLGLNPYVLMEVKYDEASDDFQIGLEAGGFPGGISPNELANLLEEMATDLRSRAA